MLGDITSAAPIDSAGWLGLLKAIRPGIALFPMTTMQHTMGGTSTEVLLAHETDSRPAPYGEACLTSPWSARGEDLV